MYGTRTDSAGAYTLSSATSSYQSGRPNTKLKIDGTWYEIIGGTAYTQTTGKGPFNVYYWRGMVSWTLTASEISTASSKTSGAIQGISIKMDDAPTKQMPNHYIGVKLVSGAANDVNNNNTGTNNGNYTQVSYTSSRNWTNTSYEGYYVDTTFTTNLAWS